MKTFKHIVTAPAGLHARPAAALVKAASVYHAKITVSSPAGSADSRSLLSLLQLSAAQGTELTVSIEGEDEEKAAADLLAFFADHL